MELWLNDIPQGGLAGSCGLSCAVAQVSPSDLQYLCAGVKAQAKKRMGHGALLWPELLLCALLAAK